MKIRKIQVNRRLVLWTIVCLLMTVLVGIVMKMKIQDIFDAYLQKQVSDRVEYASRVIQNSMTDELQKMAETAGCMPEARELITEENARGVSMGIIKRNGKALEGMPVSLEDYEGIGQSFAGEGAVSYCPGKGVLYSVPVYSGRKIPYVMYRLYEEEQIPDKYLLSCFGDEGKLLLVQKGNPVLYSKNCTPEEEEILSSRTFFPETRSGSYCYLDEQGVYFVQEEITDTDFIIRGLVAEDVVAGSIRSVSLFHLWAILFVLLAAIVIFVRIMVIFSRLKENKAKEIQKRVQEESHREKSDFLANMSHEIRTPINAILGMNEMVMRETKDENIRGYAQNIQSAGHALLSLINGVLDFSKIEAGNMEIVQTEYYLHNLVNEAVNVISSKAKQKDLLFLSRVDRNLPDLLCGDEGRIRQVIDNILNNAVKYTKEGKVMFVVSGSIDEANNTVELVFRISDTGVGIRRTDISKLFRNFERLDLIRNRSIEGVGLGLPVSYQLVQMMKGKLEVDSTYGEGSVFTVTIPQKIIERKPIGDFRRDYQEQNRDSELKGHLIAEQAEILVVDDYEMNLLVVQNLLKRTKVRVSTCRSGKECLHMMQRKHYDLIFLDHMMPEIDGIETMKISHTLRNNKCADTPIIALTANAVAGVREMYINEGFDDYLSKPVNGVLLEEMLRKYLPEEKQQILEKDGDGDRTPIDMDDIVKQRRELNTDRVYSSNIAVIEILPAAAKEDEKKTDLDDKETGPVYLDTQMGIGYTGGDRDMYREFLTLFCNSKAENQKKILTAFEAEDLKGYVTQVHALKSTSLTVGAIRLSEAAKELEMAGKEFLEQASGGVPIYILDHHAEVMELYNHTEKEARKWLETNEF